MELVQIIYDILLYGIVLLFFVVAISYWISKSKRKDQRILQSYSPASIIIERNPIVFQQEPIVEQRNVARKYSQVYPVYASINKEVNNLHKPTIASAEQHINKRPNIKTTKQVKGNNKRYTIINDEMKKSWNSSAFNY